MSIHKEGRVLLIGLLIGFIILNYSMFHFMPQLILMNQLILFISAVCYFLVLQFFRNPKRKTPISAKHIIAPADGKIVVIENTPEDEYFRDDRIQVSIFMSPIDVHVNRNPISGMVSYFKYHPGKYFVAWHPKSSTENERTSIVIKTATGVELLMRQIAGALAKRIKWYVEEGSKVEQGKEFGFIKFGSRVDLFLPIHSQIKVNLNQKVKGGKTIIAELKEEDYMNR